MVRERLRKPVEVEVGREEERGEGKIQPFPSKLTTNSQQVDRSDTEHTGKQMFLVTNPGLG